MAETPSKKPPAQPTGNPSAYRVPNNLEAERAVLGSMLLDNVCIADVVDILKAEEFYLPAHQEIYRALTTLFDQHQSVDLIMLRNELMRRNKLDEVGGVVMLAGLEQSVLSTGAAPDLARIVADKATLRKLMAAAEEILRDCSDEKRDIDKQVDVAEKLIFDISQHSSNNSFVHIKSLMEGAIEEIGKLKAQEQNITGLPTHFRDLDRLLNGLHKSDLIILAARPSIGKTAFALNIALNVAVRNRAPVGMFSLEMGREQLNMRLLCSHAQIPSGRVRSGRIREAEFTKLREVASELTAAPIYIDDSPGLSIMQLRSRARRLASQENLQLLIIDYLQLMSGTEGRGREMNRQQEVSEISRGLKALAREINVPVLALSQLSRNIEQRSGKEKGARPQLSDLRESGAIEQDADIVMFVHRERVETAKDEDNAPKDRNLPIDTEIIVGKHRNGPIGTAELLFWADFTRFTDKLST